MALKSDPVKPGKVSPAKDKMWWIVLLWLVIVTTGVTAFSKYKSSPGSAANAPSTWPLESLLPRASGLPVLVMLSHPRCPCTLASLSELAGLMADVDRKLTASVVFIKPKETADDWTNTALWKAASRIPGVHVIVDNDGVEAARFGAVTSGQVVLYDSEGRLQFRGGITGARGHVGDNLGLTRLLLFLAGKTADRADSPVFGCPLHNPQ